MISRQLHNILIYPLPKAAEIPYDLLLLADPSKELIDQYLPESEIHVAVFETQIIGVYVLHPLGDSTVEIKNIAVGDSHQGKGVGTILLNNATQTAALKGYKTVLIGTGNSSLNQLYLYQKLGFEIIEIRKDFFLEHYPSPIYENGIQCKHMLMLSKKTPLV